MKRALIVTALLFGACIEPLHAQCTSDTECRSLNPEYTCHVGICAIDDRDSGLTDGGEDGGFDAGNSR